MSVVSPALSRAITAAVPDALRPSWAHETWGGAFGTRGLRAVVTSATTDIQLRPASTHGRMQVVGSVVSGPDDVGVLQREMKLPADGRLYLQNTLLRLAPAHHGSGFATALDEHVQRRLEAGRVTAVELHAGLEAGGYVWARRGFDVHVVGTDASEQAMHRATVVRDMALRALEAGRITSAEFANVTARGGLTLPQLAALPELGRRILAGAEWRGARAVTGDADAQAAVGATARAALNWALPAAIDPVRSAAMVADSLQAQGGSSWRVDAARSVAELRLGGASDAIERLAAVHSVTTPTGARVNVELSPAGGEWRQVSPRAPRDDEPRVLDDVVAGASAAIC